MDFLLKVFPNLHSTGKLNFRQKSRNLLFNKSKDKVQDYHSV